MKKATLAILVVVLFGAPAGAQQPDFETRVQSALAEWDRKDAPGIAVAVVHDGRIVLERGYGLAQLEHRVPITPATVFHVASVSKQFAAFAITLLAQQERLGLDDDVRKHLPEIADLGHKVTIRHLIHHTSGVRDQWELLQMAGWRMDDVITRAHIMAMMTRQRALNFVPGTEHLYSNMGYTLLAEIVERVSGTSYSEFLQRNVFGPLGMTSTHVHNDHEMIVPNRAYSYRPRGSEWGNAVLSYANQGATSLFTTIGDLARWLHNFETAQVGGRAVIDQMRQRGVLNNGDTIPYAFALTRGVYRGRTAWGHSGSDAGFRSIVMHMPAERLGIIVLSNAANANPNRLAQQIADAWFGDAATPTAAAQPPRDEPPPTWQPTPEELSAVAGDYYSAELATVYTLEVRDGWLHATHPRLASTRLAPISRDLFRSGSRTYRLARDARGAVVGFALSGSRVRNLSFVRLTPGAIPR
jgi:CubicO group peptidase (beta-lactamase class C family)